VDLLQVCANSFFFLHHIAKKLKESILCSAFVGGAQNPFAVKPMHHFWAPWIGKNTRRSDIVLNTEYEKLQSSKSPSETAEITVTEERLKEELQKQTVCFYYLKCYTLKRDVLKNNTHHVLMVF